MAPFMRAYIGLSCVDLLDTLLEVKNATTVIVPLISYAISLVDI